MPKQVVRVGDKAKDMTLPLLGNVMPGKVSYPAINGTNVQKFLANGTWVKPPGALMVRVFIISPGGSGGGGGNSIAGTAAGSGAGGSGGGYSEMWYMASDLGATETITIPVAPAGGAPSGNGAAGGIASFGAWLGAQGPTGVAQGGVGAVPGGATATGLNLGTVGQIVTQGAAGNITGVGATGGESIQAANFNMLLPGAGGGGAGFPAAHALANGGPGGRSSRWIQPAPNAGGLGGVGAGGAGGQGAAGLNYAGAGGGGGATGSIAAGTAGGNGGKGGNFGGGGGGGGAGTNASLGGSGGAGGDGIIIVTTFF